MFFLNFWWWLGNPSPRPVFYKKSFTFNQKFSATFDLIKASDESLLVTYFWSKLDQKSSAYVLNKLKNIISLGFCWNICSSRHILHMASHYSVFSFHLYSNCGFLALSYIYPAIWWLLPRLTSSKHAPHKNACSSNYH